jgi:hypothetical protein
MEGGGGGSFTGDFERKVRFFNQENVFIGTPGGM